MNQASSASSIELETSEESYEAPPKAAPKRRSKKVFYGKHQCSQCGTTETPQWRFLSTDHPMCNACGLAFSAMQKKQGKQGKTSPPKRQKLLPAKPLPLPMELLPGIYDSKSIVEAFPVNREFVIDAWDEENLDKLAAELNQMLWRMAIRVACQGKVLFFDYIYLEIVDVNPNSDSPALYETLEDSGWKGWNFRGVEIEPATLATLKIQSLLPLLSSKLVSIRLQLETLNININYPTPAAEIASMMRHGIGSCKRKLNTDGGAFKRAEVEPLLEETYSQIQLEIKSKINGSQSLNITFSSDESLKDILQTFYADSRDTRAILTCIFTTFRNCYDVAKRAPTILRSLSVEQDLLDMFAHPPDQCSYENFAKLQTVSRLLELKGVY
jgi:hypothetical protein